MLARVLLDQPTGGATHSGSAPAAAPRTTAEMSAKVSFLENQPAATQQSRITVPKGAVRIEEGKTYVWTVRRGIVQRVGIVRGQETETGIEIKQGLNDGDVVVVSPQANLANGRKVSVGTESNGRMK